MSVNFIIVVVITFMLSQGERSKQQILPHVPGIVTHVSACAHICTHGFEGHNLWHTVYITFDDKNNVRLKNILQGKNAFTNR